MGVPPHLVEDYDIKIQSQLLANRPSQLRLRFTITGVMVVTLNLALMVLTRFISMRKVDAVEDMAEEVQLQATAEQGQR